MPSANHPLLNQIPIRTIAEAPAHQFDEQPHFGRQVPVARLERADADRRRRILDQDGPQLPFLKHVSDDERRQESDALVMQRRVLEDLAVVRPHGTVDRIRSVVVRSQQAPFAAGAEVPVVKAPVPRKSLGWAGSPACSRYAGDAHSTRLTGMISCAIRLVDGVASAMRRVTSSAAPGPTRLVSLWTQRCSTACRSRAVAGRRSTACCGARVTRTSRSTTTRAS